MIRMNKEQLQDIFKKANPKLTLPYEKEMQFIIEAQGIYKVKSCSGETYIIDIDNQTCTCKGWYYTKNCKHIRRLKRGGKKL